MVKVKSLDEAKKRFEGSVSIVPERYKSGVQQANWKEKATSDEAERLWKAKLQEAMNANRRQKALDRVSNEDWKQAAIAKGANRIAEGMRQSSSKWAQNWAPYKSALEQVELPEKTTDPIQNVTNRVGAVVKALVDKKKELLGE